MDDVSQIALDAMLPIAERFVSIDGEGPNAGRLAAFIRTVGCNLACSYCDTRWACVPSCPHEDVSIAALVDWVAGSGAACVTLTGGEPLLQPHAAALVEALATTRSWCADAARTVEIETNGAVALDEVAYIRDRLALEGVVSLDAAERAGLARICFTLDAKTPASGMDERMLASNYRLLAPCDAVKFVVGSCEDLCYAQQVLERYGLCERCAVFFSPVFGAIDPAEIVAFMQEHALARARLQLQLHKIIWPDAEKGV